MQGILRRQKCKESSNFFLPLSFQLASHQSHRIRSLRVFYILYLLRGIFLPLHRVKHRNFDSSSFISLGYEPKTRTEEPLMHGSGVTPPSFILLMCHDYKRVSTNHPARCCRDPASRAPVRHSTVGEVENLAYTVVISPAHRRIVSAEDTLMDAYGFPDSVCGIHWS